MKRSTYVPVVLALSAMLAGCSTQPAGTPVTSPPVSTTPSNTIAGILAQAKVLYPEVREAAEAYIASGKASPDVVAILQKAIADTDAAFSANGLTDPNSVSAAIGDISSIVGSLPAGTISAADEQHVMFILGLAQALATNFNLQHAPNARLAPAK